MKSETINGRALFGSSTVLEFEMAQEEEGFKQDPHWLQYIAARKIK